MPRVLVVDDDPAVRGVLRMFLEQSGYGVLEAANGREALPLVDSVDLLLTDIVMPDMEGVGLIRQARNLRRSLPIIAMSGAPMGDQYLMLADRLGADGTLAKPITRDRLLETLRDVLEERPLT